MSGTVEHSVTVYRDHDGSEDVCDHCDRRYAVLFAAECSTCHYSTNGIPNICLLAETDLLAFLIDHGLNPLVPKTRERAPGALANYEEDVLSTDPVRVALTFTVDDDALTLTIDENVYIVDVGRDRVSGSIR